MIFFECQCGQYEKDLVCVLITIELEMSELAASVVCTPGGGRVIRLVPYPAPRPGIMMIQNRLGNTPHSARFGIILGFGFPR